MTVEDGRVAGFGRLEDGLKQASPWYTWGPYVSERQYVKSDDMLHDMLYPGNQS